MSEKNKKVELEMEHGSSPAPGASDLRPSDPNWNQHHELSALRLLNYNASFPGSPAYKLQIVRLLSFHKYMK
jgi:hypothetical protein